MRRYFTRLDGASTIAFVSRPPDAADRTRIRWRALAGAGALLLLAGAYWPQTIDDSFISAAYAHALAGDRGLIWPGGDRIEGYSNFGWVLMMALVARLGGDVIVWAKLASLFSGLALVAVASRWLPHHREGDLALAALVAWSPLAYWSAMPLETTSFALCVVLGWMAALAQKPQGMVWLVVAALLRPEGALWLAMAGGVQLRASRRAAIWVAACVLAVAAYHLWRIRYFGSVLPAAVWLKAHLGWFVVPQLVAEAVAGAGLLAACALFGLGRRAVVGWLPLALSLALLVVMNGDWMGRARMLLPGVTAFLVARGHLGQPRVSRRRFWITVALVVASSPLEPLFLQWPRLRALAPRYHRGLETPLEAPLWWLVSHAPDGAVVQSADVGILGHVPRMTIVDSRGLVSSRFLRARREQEWSAIAAWYESPDRPDVIEVSRYMPDDFLRGQALAPYEGLDPWLRQLDAGLSHYPHHDDVFHAEGSWQGAIRFHRTERRAIDLDLSIARWRALVDRFPSQPFLAWQLAMSLAAVDRLDEAMVVAKAGDDGGDGPLGDAPASLSLPLGEPCHYQAGRGFLVTHRKSTPVAAGAVLSIDAPAPFSVELRWEPIEACDLPVPTGFAGSAGTHRIRLEAPACRARIAISATPPVWASLAVENR
jgi:hypothetical protein